VTGDVTAQDVVNAILGVTQNLEVRESMLVGSYLESGWNQTAVGDQGTSFGPFQMHVGGSLTSAGGTPALAENPIWAAQHMLDAYQNAAATVPGSTWAGNPELAAEEAAVIAERPAESYYQSQGSSRVNEAWVATQGALKGKVSTAGTPNSAIISAANSAAAGVATLAGGTTAATTANLPFPGGALDPLNWPAIAANKALSGIEGEVTKLWKDVEVKAKDWAIRLGLIILGVIILYAGLNSMLKPSAGTTQILVSGAKRAATRGVAE
jgi:hypothetical protein